MKNNYKEVSIMKKIKYDLAFFVMLVALIFEVRYVINFVKRERNLECSKKIERTMEALSGTDFTVVDNGDGTFNIIQKN